MPNIHFRPDLGFIVFSHSVARSSLFSVYGQIPMFVFYLNRGEVTISAPKVNAQITRTKKNNVKENFEGRLKRSVYFMDSNALRKCSWLKENGLLILNLSRNDSDPVTFALLIG